MALTPAELADSGVRATLWARLNSCGEGPEGGGPSFVSQDPPYPEGRSKTSVFVKCSRPSCFSLSNSIIAFYPAPGLHPQASSPPSCDSDYTPTGAEAPVTSVHLPFALKAGSMWSLNSAQGRRSTRRGLPSVRTVMSQRELRRRHRERPCKSSAPHFLFQCCSPL